MALKIVGGERLLARWEHRPDGSTRREVRNAFKRVSAQGLLSGSDGFFEVGYDPSLSSPNPWLGVDRVEIERTVAATLQSSGLAAQICRVKVELAAAELVPRAHCRLELESGCELSDQQVWKAFNQAWPHGRMQIPPLTIAQDVAGAWGARGEAPSPVAALGALPRLCSVDQEGFFRVRSDQLSDQERAVLRRWSGSVAPSARKQIAARQLLALLSSPTDLSTEAGRNAIEALCALELFSPFWSRGLALLSARFAPRQLAQSMILYNGHPTWAMTSLLPTLNAFGAAATSLWLSKHSGGKAPRELIWLQQPTHLHPEAAYQELDPVTQSPRFTIAGLVDTRLRLPLEDWQSHHMIIDKMGPWLKTLGGRRPAQLVRGLIRGVIHNRDDLDAIGPFRDLLWAVDLANSGVKETEARFIGEQYALMGAREVRTKGWGRIGDGPVIINGLGLLGEKLAQAFCRLGMPADRIVVLDSDLSVAGHARDAGYCTAWPVPRPERAVVFNATPGPGLTLKDLSHLGNDLIVLSMTSGGKGLDMGKLLAAAQSQVEVPCPRRSQIPIRDLDLTIARADASPLSLRVIAEGWPPNLVDDMWLDRYQLTSLGVSGTLLQASELTEPGIVPFDPKLDKAIVDAARAEGLFELRPLDPRPGEDLAELLADLQAFTPSPA